MATKMHICLLYYSFHISLKKPEGMVWFCSHHKFITVNL